MTLKYDPRAAAKARQPHQPLWPLLRRAYGYLRPHWRPVAAAYLLMLLINGMSALIPQLIRAIVDRGIANKEATFLTWAVFGLLGLTVAKSLLTFLQGRWIEVASQSAACDIRNHIQRRLTELSFSFHDGAEAGQLLSRVMQDAERIRFLTGRATWRLVDALVLIAVTSVVLFWMNPKLALLTLMTIPLLLHRGYYFGRRFRFISYDIQDQLGTLTARIEQNLRGARVVKAFAQEDAETGRYDTENEYWFDLSAQAARIQSFNVPLMDLIANAGTVLIIWYGGLLVIRGEVTFGELVAFTTYLAQLFNPVRTMGRVIPILAVAGSSAERIFGTLDTRSEVADELDAVPLDKVEGHVKFEDVSFSYRDTHSILENISLEVKPGQVIALLGATGSGKSTITNLIPRFYDPTSGRITIDGHDTKNIQLASLRQHIGIVLQETTLFAASIAENIAFGRPDATQADIEAAAKAAQAHDFIMEQLSEGYDTYVGERGTTLSGGQKQRVAIARALLTNPRILILDDATAAVDTQTEKLIQTALQTLMEGRTTFVIAHRLSTVRRADWIILLENGRIAAQGGHDELMRDNAHYRAVYQRQLRREDSE